MTQRKPLRFGILEAGMIADDEDGFLPNLATLGDKAEITTVADVMPEHAQRIVQRFGIDTVHESLDEMLRGDHAETVASLAPTFVHAETPIWILRNGRHLLSEKPLATTLEGADALIERAEQQGVIFVCAPPDMLYAQYREARRLIDKDRIRQMCFTRVRSSHDGPGGVPDGWPFNSTWLCQPGGGPLFGMGVYGIHEITSLLGPARQVSAFGDITKTVCIVREAGPFGGLRIPVTTPDNFLLMLDFGSSIFTMVDATFNILASKVPKVEVFRWQGAVAICHRGENPLEVLVQDLEPGIDARMAPKDLSRANNVREQELYRAMLMERLVDCVRSSEPPVADAYKTRHALRIMATAIESARSGRVVELATSFQVIMSDDVHAGEAAQLSPELARKSGNPPQASLGYRIRHNYILGCILKNLITIWAAAILSFILVRQMPGNPLQTYAQKLMTQQGPGRQEALARASSPLFYDPGTPLLDQYLTYLGGLMQGNLGQSTVALGISVIDYILACLPWTLFNVDLGLLLSFLIGIALGVLIAYKHGRWIDHLVTNVFSALNAVPNYMWAMLVVVVFGVQLRWFNASSLRGTLAPGIQPGFTVEFILDAPTHAVLPVTVYILTSVGGWIPQMKSSTTQILEDDYVIGAKTRGLPGPRIHISYVGHNAILPLFIQLAVRLDLVVGGSALVEQIFRYDDVRYYFYDAIVARNYPVVQGFILIITVSVVLANLMADLLLSRVDPRIRVESTR